MATGDTSRGCTQLLSPPGDILHCQAGGRSDRQTLSPAALPPVLTGKGPQPMGSKSETIGGGPLVTSTLRPGWRLGTLSQKVLHSHFKVIQPLLARHEGGHLSSQHPWEAEAGGFQPGKLNKIFSQKVKKAEEGAQDFPVSPTKRKLVSHSQGQYKRGRATTFHPELSVPTHFPALVQLSPENPLLRCGRRRSHRDGGIL